MKFESSINYLKGISYSSFAAVILLAAFLYLATDKVSEKSFANAETAKQNIELQKKINEQANKIPQVKAVNLKTVESNSNAESAVAQETEKKDEVRKISQRELGFDLDFGSDQPRIIKNFVLPEAKNLGSGRVIMKFRFSIRPDGSVSKVFPTMKGDPALELTTMNLLRKWRFEKLPAAADQIDQKVEISFRPQ
ncbi:MAG: TonB family protein [Ignavibacteria bacterium]|nr:MAG: TonB family protein [Ignavibacteria bacterium]KAF0157279.1 MAG: TonB family protein [Ignavibacteria bacterium]